MYYTSNYYRDPYSTLGILGGFLGVIILFAVAFAVISIVANWKIFTKANQPGWACIVPFYSSFVEYKIFWGNGWLFLVPLACVLLSGIPFIGTILAFLGLVITAVSCYKRSEAFGQGIGFAVGLFFLGFIFNCILAFGKYQYFGIPQDGCSYDQMKARYDNYRAQKAANGYTQPQQPQQNMNYAQPQAPQQNVMYTQPQQPQYTAPVQPQYQQPQYTAPVQPQYTAPVQQPVQPQTTDSVQWVPVQPTPEQPAAPSEPTQQ